MRVGSLFSGIGGFDLGLQRAGMKITWQVEIDEWCRKVLAKHWPDVERFGDICNVTKKELKPVELICGGFPCQPFSNAGKRKGKEDDRYLWPEMLRVISELRPHWVIGENVAGLINMELENMLADLETEGYEVETFVLPACAIGANHRRDRVWIVAYADSNRLESPIQKSSFIDRLHEQASEQATPFIDTERIFRQADHRNNGTTNGISDWMDRSKSIGNAVVTQLVEVLGRYIIEADKILFGEPDNG